MSAGYVVANVDVKDPERYKEYTAQTPAVIAQYGGEFVVRGGRFEALEGAPPMGRVVIIRFPSFDQALTWYRSEEYGPLAELRQSISEGRLFVVEGVD
jgi:uncharacterized protein (DUF1330 family)